MKPFTKLLSCMLALLMMASCAMAAAAPVDHAALKRFPAYTLDAETGKWSVQTYQADALTDQFWSYGRRYNTTSGVFYLSAEGDARTGVWSPVLRLYITDANPINARAISLLAGDERMDLAASSQRVVNGRYAAEVVTAPLNPAGWAFVSAMVGAQSAAVRVMGDEVYTIQVDVNGTGERRQMEAASLRMLENGVALMNELGVESYELWDLSADAWEREHGFRPASTVSKVQSSVCGVEIPDVMGMVCPEDSSEATQKAQESLAEYGFFSGIPTRRHDATAIAATLRAQKVLGRVPTGCFDDALAAAMAQGVTAEESAQPELLPVGGAVLANVDRWWFAKGVSASKNPDTLRSVTNQDNLFLVADGCLASLSAKEMHLFVDMDASVVYNGQYSYQAELALEGSEGMALDTLLLPLSQARLIAYAEIPAQLAQDEQAAWSLVLTHNGESLTIELK